MQFSSLSNSAVSYMVIPFDIFESAQAANVEGIQSVAITDGQVPCLRAIWQHRGDQSTVHFQLCLSVDAAAVP